MHPSLVSLVNKQPCLIKLICQRRPDSRGTPVGWAGEGFCARALEHIDEGELLPVAPVASTQTDKVRWPSVIEVKEIQLVSKKGMTQCKQRRCLIVLVSAQLRESFRGTLGVCRHGTKRLAAFAQSLTRNNNKCIP